MTEPGPFHPATQGRALTVAREGARLRATHGLAGEPLKRALADVPTDPADVAACWVGRARMAHARQAAGAELDPIDLEAIRRHPACPPIDPRTTP